LDVLVASTSDDSIRYLESNGAAVPAFTTRVVTSVADGAYTVIGSDLDTDGDIE
jgi:hypothetical protein